MLSYSEEATSSAMKTYIKELVADAYGWPTVSLMNEPKPMDGEDHSGTSTPFSEHTVVQLDAYPNWY